MNEQEFQKLIVENEPLPCMDAPEIFFAQDRIGRSFEDAETALATDTRNRLAKKMCNDCPIRRECLSYAIANNIEYGIWGQTTPKERVRIRRI